MKSTKIGLLLIAILAVFVVMSGCGIQESTGDIFFYVSGGGYSKQVMPAVDLAVDHYDVTGVGPGGATFNRTFTAAESGGSVEGLILGDWTVTAVAHSTEIALGEDSQVVELTQAGAIVNLNILNYLGTGNLTQCIAYGSYVQPGVFSWVGYYPGSTTPDRDYAGLYSITDNLDGTCTASVTTMEQTGWMTITSQLYPETIGVGLVSGLADLVLIVKDQFTVTDWLLPIQSTFQINITSSFYYQVQCHMEGVPSVWERFSIPFTANLVIDSGELPSNLFYVWYTDGILQDSGVGLDTYTIPSDLGKSTPGWRLDCIVASIADGGLGGGSNFAMFDVIVTP